MTNMTLQGKIQVEIRELASSIGAIVQNFKELHSPLAESREKVPVATQQLDKISEQTEAATHRVLDLVEQIMGREEQVIDGLQKIQESMDDHSERIPELVAGLTDLANTNLADTYTIMDALQFQDITAQQIDHAASLLEEIETKLSRIGRVIDGDDTVQAETDPPKKNRVFDPNADLFSKKTDQAMIDSLIEQKAARS
ncbi:MAG: protein phosphatase CheZ [bacterium]